MGWEGAVGVHRYSWTNTVEASPSKEMLFCPHVGLADMVSEIEKIFGAIYGVTRSRTRLSYFTFTFHFHALEKEMATHSNVLAWRIPGTGKPRGLPSMGSHRVRHDWSDLAAAAACYCVCREYMNPRPYFSYLRMYILQLSPAFHLSLLPT